MTQNVWTGRIHIVLLVSLHISLHISLNLVSNTSNRMYLYRVILFVCMSAIYNVEICKGANPPNPETQPVTGSKRTLSEEEKKMCKSFRLPNDNVCIKHCGNRDSSGFVITVTRCSCSVPCALLRWKMPRRNPQSLKEVQISRMKILLPTCKNIAMPWPQYIFVFKLFVLKKLLI